MPPRSIAEADAATGSVTPQQGGQASGSAVATQQSAADMPAMAMLKAYWPQVRALLPPHIKPAAWYSAVYAALYRGQDPSKNIDLYRCANANPESLIFALFDAARQGLMPGTEQYYLTPRPNKNAKNKVEVLGIRGYQGEIELIYNAGAVSSVIVEVARRNDQYRYRRGIDSVPLHLFDPWASHASRGPLVGVYAYGVMRDGAISRVVELNVDDIAHAKAKSPGRGESGPWLTDEAAMWLKTGVHRLQKFVPTSTERLYAQAVVAAAAEHVGAARGDQARRELAADAQPHLPTGQAGGQPPSVAPPVVVVPQDDDAPPAPPLDESRFAQPAAPEDPDPADNAPSETERHTPPAPELDVQTEFPPVAGQGDDEPAAKPQTTAIARILKTSDEERLAISAHLVGHTKPLESTSKLTKREASQVISTLTGWMDAATFVAQVSAVLEAATAAGLALPKPGTKAWHDQQHPTRVESGQLVRVPVTMSGDCSICIELDEERQHATGGQS